MPVRSGKARLAALAVLAAVLVPEGPVQAQQATGVELESVVVANGDTTVVTFDLTGSVEGTPVAGISLTGPERLVVEIPGARQPAAPPAISGTGGLVTSVATEEIADDGGALLRVTLNLAGAADHLLTIEGDRVSVSLVPSATARVTTQPGERPLSGPAVPAGAPPTVSTLDFENLDAVSRIVIGTNARVDFTASRPEANLLVLDLPGATLASSLERPMDASEFLSPVRMVRAYRTRTGTRIAVSLRQQAEFQVREAGTNLIHLDVVVPDDMRADRDLARQGFTAAAPAGAGAVEDGSLRSAYQQEVLIGASGRTVQPQAVFGAGSGSNDPSSLTGFASGFMYDQSSATNLPYTGQRINVDLVNADIHSVFRLISHVSKLNIVAGDDVDGRVTVRLENVPWDQAFAAILQARGLGSQRFGNIVRIAPIDTIKAEQQAALEAKQAHELLEPLQVYVVPLNYATAAELTEQVASVLSERGSVEVDGRSNQLIIEDTEPNIARARELIRQLDRQNSKIVIEARVVEATSKKSRGLGIQWGGELNASASTGYATGAFFPSSVGVGGGLTTGGTQAFYTPGESNLLADLTSPQGELAALALNLGSIPGLINLDVRLGAMESEGWGRIVSSPNILTMDNEPAFIKQGQRIPYLSTSAGGTQVKFIDAALTLSVTPHLTSEGQVALDIEVENNRADFSTVVQGQPAIQIKEAKTSVLVDDGDTTVIGGVFAAEEAFNQSSVPFISKIPLLGLLFRNSGTSQSRNELLVFITPRVVNTAVSEE